MPYQTKAKRYGDQNNLRPEKGLHQRQATTNAPGNNNDNQLRKPLTN